jgi:hypothetical protein
MKRANFRADGLNDWNVLNGLNAANWLDDFVVVELVVL